MIISNNGDFTIAIIAAFLFFAVPLILAVARNVYESRKEAVEKAEDENIELCRYYQLSDVECIFSNWKVDAPDQSIESKLIAKVELTNKHLTIDSVIISGERYMEEREVQRIRTAGPEDDFILVDIIRSGKFSEMLIGLEISNPERYALAKDKDDKYFIIELSEPDYESVNKGDTVKAISGSIIF